MVRSVCATCEVRAKFRVKMPCQPWGQTPSSRVLGHTVYGDIIGPLTKGRGGVAYVQCFVDSATRMGGAYKLRSTHSAGIIRGIREWVGQYGKISVLVIDNVAYYCSNEVHSWCNSNGVEHKFVAPYRHESNGLVERYNRTLIDRLRKLRMAHGGSWVDYLGIAVNAINESVHRVMGFSPTDLWIETLEE